MDYPKFVASNQLEESISIRRVKRDDRTQGTGQKKYPAHNGSNIKQWTNNTRLIALERKQPKSPGECWRCVSEGISALDSAAVKIHELLVRMLASIFIQLNLL